MSVTFNSTAAWNRIATKIGAGVNATAQEAADVARDKAPVRKVFAAPRGSPIHGMGPRRLMAGPGRLKMKTPLTSRGRYELRSGRAVFSGSGGDTLGGRLRGEIYVEPAEGAGPLWVAKVVSPTRYAKYVEFGTRRSRAQPYMRPALAQVRGSFRDRMRAARG